MKHKITLIPGDGIGPEVTKPTLKIIKAAGVKVEWETHLAGAEALKKHGTTIPKQLIDSFKKNKIALKGPVTTPVGEGFASVNVELRQTFDLYANLRPIKNLPGVKARYSDVDLIVVRENTEGLYSGIEHEVVPGVMESLKIITEKASTRIANLPSTWLSPPPKKNRRDPQSQHHETHRRVVPRLCEKNVSPLYRHGFQRSHRRQCLFATRARSPQTRCSAAGKSLRRYCVGSGRRFGWRIGCGPRSQFGRSTCAIRNRSWQRARYQGEEFANPTAMILAVVMMLERISEKAAARRIHDSLEAVLMKGEVLTPDLGGSGTTTKFADAIIKEIER